MTLTAKPCFIEVLVEMCDHASKKKEPQEFFSCVRDHLKKAIEDTELGCHSPMVGFYCPKGFQLEKRPHFAEIEGAKALLCSLGENECCTKDDFPGRGYKWFPREVSIMYIEVI